jgi:hypothetical protein
LARGTEAFWGGGEPTLLADFEQTITVLNQHDAKQVLNTNCLQYSDSIEKSLVRSPATSLTCSIDAGSAETYRSVKGADCFDYVRENLARYARAGNPKGGDLLRDSKTRPKRKRNLKTRGHTRHLWVVETDRPPWRPLNADGSTYDPGREALREFPASI